jgi:peptide/nickel transport system substrate-binding protein
MFRFFPSLRTFVLKTFPILAIVAVLSIGGCRLEDFKSEAAQVPQLIEGVISDPKTFNAALSQESPNIFGYTYEGLLTANGLTGEIEPALAKSLPEISADKKRLVFTLQSGLKWSDGHPLTADDVVFTFNEIYFNEKIPTSTRDIFQIGESGALPQVRKIDDLRIEVLLPEPFSPVLRSFSAEILPAHILQESIKKTDASGNPEFLDLWGTDTAPEKIVVNGMYQLKEYIPSQRVIFERNPYYWRKDPQGNAQPYIDKIVWQIVENQDTQLLQFRSGGLSSVNVAPQYFSLLKREEKRGDFTIYGGEPDLGTTFISFNLNQGKDANGKPLVNPIRSAWFNNLEFRKAIAHAIDRQTMINNIYRGLGSLQNSPLPSASPYYLSPEAGLPTYEYNLKKSKELLLGAGFQYNTKGELLDATGNRVRFTLLTNAGNQIREAIGSQVKQDLSKIGIQVDFTPIDFNTLVTKLKDTLDWECHLIGFTGGIEPHGGSTIWSTEGRLHAFNQNREDPPISGRKISDWEQEISRLYIQGAQEFDEAKRKKIYQRTQTLAQENLPFIYLVNQFSMAAVRNDVQTIQYSSLGGAFWNLHELKVQE